MKRRRLKPSLLDVATLLAVAAVLAAVLAPNFIKARKAGELSPCKSNLKNIGTACEMYSTDNQGRYPLTLNGIAPNYLKVIPVCPVAGRQTYVYRSTSVPDLYTVVCSGLYHSGPGITSPNYPEYTSVQGLIEK